MTINLYISDREAKEFLKRSGFKLINIRNLLKRSGWDASEIKKVRKHILRYTFAYLSVDEVKFFDKASQVMEYVRTRRLEDIWSTYDFCITGRGTYYISLYDYGVSSVMSRIITSLNDQIIGAGDFFDYLVPKKEKI